MNTLISVIVPVFNVDKFINKCINSILSQTYKNIEVIVVDDGSTDKSGSICDKYSNVDSRIRVVHKKNEGLGYARNTGLGLCKGDYVVFVDSDDFLDKNSVRSLYEGIKTRKVDTCIGGFKSINEKNVLEKTVSYKEETYRADTVYTEFFPRLLGSLPNKRDAIRMSVWNAMYSVDIIRKNKILFPSEKDFISEDIIWDIEYYRYSKGVSVINSALYNYRSNPQSLSKKFKKNKFEQSLKLFDELKRRIIKYNLPESAINRSKRQLFVTLKVCLSQEKNNPDSSFNNTYRNIHEIINNNNLISIVKDYPISQMQIAPKFFLFLVKKRSSLLLTILVKFKLI